MSRYADHLPCIVGRAPTRVDNDVVRNELDVHVSLRGSTWLGEGVDKRTDQRSFLAVAVVHVEDIATGIGSEIVEFDGHILQCKLRGLTGNWLIKVTVNSKHVWGTLNNDRYL